MFNRAILIGRLTADPELKATGTGVHVTGFTVAVDRKFKQDGEKKADFINIQAWRQTAEFICKYFHKGDPIGVEGSIQVRQYEDKTGAKRTAVEVVADNVFFVGCKGMGQGEQNASQPLASPANSEFEEIETDDDLPF